MNILERIQKCCQLDSVYYSRHALDEMKNEEFGRVHVNEVLESILNGEIIQEYPEDSPYPSVLFYGQTNL